MKQYFTKLSFLIVGLVLLGAFLLYWVLTSEARNAPTPITTIVEEGSVRQMVSVSGIAKATSRVELAFPTGGIVESVLVKKGQIVEVGQPLITLKGKALSADRKEATATLAAAIADRNELIAGPTASDRSVTSETVAAKEVILRSTIETEGRLVKNAKRSLYSTGLSSYTNNSNEDAAAPIVSGTYKCDKIGTYRLDVYSSGGQSGYSYRLSGIESGTFNVSTEQAVALGACGLRIIFDKNSNYSRTVWFIDIPNQKSIEYTATRNAYELAKITADNNIAVARQELLLAQASASNTNAPARSEAIVRANAKVTEAEARLARIDAGITDNTLTAPFKGTVTDIDILPGEIVGINPVVTVVASDLFEIIARVPEIDIGKLSVGQNVEMLFDAKSDEILTGKISFISLQATEIDGVAYYEATIVPDQSPTWIRNGLNADIDIIINERRDVLKIPKRFLIKENNEYTVLKMTGEKTASTPVSVILEGNDGYVAITGVSASDILVAP